VILLKLIHVNANKIKLNYIFKFLRKFKIKMWNDSEYYTKCEKIMYWATFINKKFDTAFIESLISYYKDRDEFTPRQKQSIDNIINKWNIKISDDALYQMK
tara:strand:- start:683 stop:985 length:303 start_codon:yes stop_codon:yes gene_type:complete